MHYYNDDDVATRQEIVKSVDIIPCSSVLRHAHAASAIDRQVRIS